MAAALSAAGQFVYLNTLIQQVRLRALQNGSSTLTPRQVYTLYASEYPNEAGPTGRTRVRVLRQRRPGGDEMVRG